ncbi:MAG: UDP-N-acetylmuramate dehydrogenase [Synergistales bacterium]|nr:UDP-N-acetylmuramate dehydrogenase [Synergistales bacterium]
MPWLSALEEELTCQCRRHVPLHHHTTWGTGGPVEAFVSPALIEDIVALYRLRNRYGFPIWALGGGSNVLVPDRGLPGVLLHTANLQQQWVEERGACVTLIAESGVPLHRLLARCSAEGWTGLEFMAGIPGSLGGAVFCNSGTKMQSICQRLRWVDVIESDEAVRRYSNEEFAWSYRHCSLRGFVYRVALELEPSVPATVRRRIRECLKDRSRQPQGRKTAGCVFKNPDGMSAGRLLEECGCKGLRIGGARVSPSHCNFIENIENAASKDILELIGICQRRLRAEKHIDVGLEVQLLGECGDGCPA